MLCREGLGACQEKWSKSTPLPGKFLPESGLETAREGEKLGSEPWRSERRTEEAWSRSLTHWEWVEEDIP